jgi:hypothetical protein
VSTKRIALAYAKTWLAFDFLAAYPLLLVPGVNAAVGIVGTLKLLRLLRLGPLLVHLEKETHWFNLTSLRVATLTSLFCHVMTCMWRISRRIDESSELPSGGDLFEVYVEDTYWLQMTMTTVGYGDVPPCGVHSRLFAVFAMMMAPIFFGSIVSLLTYATQGLLNDAESRRAAEAVRFMQRRRVPKDLQRRVVRNLITS